MDMEKIALQTALAGVFSEAKDLGMDVEAIAKATESGLFDSSKRYRWASADCVAPAIEAIKRALEIANRSK